MLIRSHNAVERIESCISSVYGRQAVKPDKLFICDDCSTDGTWELLLDKYGSDPNVKLLRNDSNYGPGHTLRRLIMSCDTDYYMLIDDDDTWISSDVIMRVKNDLIKYNLPDKIYYRANDACNWRLHTVFVYKTDKMQRLNYFSLWCNDDDYTLQTLGPDFREAIIDDYVFQCPYVGHGVSRMRPARAYRLLQRICKAVYLSKEDLARQAFEQFPFIHECTPQDLVIYRELTDFSTTNS